ncbi:MAG: phage portal protein [Steroidobacteraceae bacterium]
MRKPTLRHRVQEWAANRVAQSIWSGRRRNHPVRESAPYARLMTIGGWGLSDKRPLIKPTPANLRMFARTPYARAAIRRIKNPIANLEWEVAPKKNVEWNRELRNQAAIATACLEQPNHDDSFRSFLEQTIEDLCINGAGSYEQQVGGDRARPLWAWPVDSLSIQINPKWDGSRTDPRYYQTLGYGNIGGVQGIALTNEELVYIRQEPSTENPFGLGDLEIAFATINRKLGVENYAGKLASNRQPENLLLFPGMDDEQLATVRGFWRNEVEGEGTTPIMSPPLSGDGKTVAGQVLKLRGTDDAALFLKYQDLLIREIAVSFNLSAMSLNVEHDVNRSTAEVVDDRDWDSAIVPKATLIAAYITRESINTRLGFSQLQLRFLGLKREDKKAEAEIFELEYQSNAVTPNEYRARNGMAPLKSEWADLTGADVEIAKMAARGTAEIDDPDLPPARGAGAAAAATKRKSKSKEN